MICPVISLDNIVLKKGSAVHNMRNDRIISFDFIGFVKRQKQNIICFPPFPSPESREKVLKLEDVCEISYCGGLGVARD